MLTKDQENILKLNGWRHDYEGFWYKCRVCHNICASYDDVWISPNYAFYHTTCVEKSTQVKKLLKSFNIKSEE